MNTCWPDELAPCSLVAYHPRLDIYFSVQSSETHGGESTRGCSGGGQISSGSNRNCTRLHANTMASFLLVILVLIGLLTVTALHQPQKGAVKALDGPSGGNQIRRSIASTLVGSAVCLMLSGNDAAVAASGQAPPAPVYGLKKERLLPCKSLSNCISSSSINSIEKYGRPWSFGEGRSGKDEFEDIKAALKSTDYLTVQDVDNDKMYVRAEAKSAVPPSGMDDIELLVNGLDHIVTYRSNSREVVMAGTSVVPDGGSNRNRLATIQRKLNLKEMSLNSDVEEALDAKPDFFSYQKKAQAPSEINFVDNSVPEMMP